MGLKCLEKACSLNEPEACLNLFHLYFDGKMVPQNRQKAVEYAAKSCELGNIAGCINANVMYKNGDGIPKDEEKAKYYRGIAEEHYNMLTKKNDTQIVFGEGHKNFKL